MTEETPAERRRRKTRERQQRKRERDRQRREAMDIQDLCLPLAAVEREMIRDTAEKRGFEDVTEYVSYLVRADRELMEINPKVNPAAECVTRHVKALCAKRDTPEISGEQA